MQNNITLILRQVCASTSEHNYDEEVNKFYEQIQVNLDRLKKSE